MEDNSTSEPTETVLPQQGDKEQQLEDEIVGLRQEKARTKTCFTKARRCLLVVIHEKEVTVETIQNACETVDGALETVMDIMMSLTDKYREARDRSNASKVCKEIETIEMEYSAAQSQAQEVITELNRVANLSKFVRQIETKSQDAPQLLVSHEQQNSARSKEVSVHQPIVSSRGNTTNVYQSATAFYRSANPNKSLLEENEISNVTNPSLIGQDLWKQLKRVTIPVFSGDKKSYQNWKAAFTTCVDQAPATSEYKLLQLRQCLAGEALRSVESLGHSATAYRTALDRLERKFGGERRQIAIYLEEIDTFRPVRYGNSKDIEKFADLLDIAIVNLKESNRYEELKDGMLYIKLQKKLPATMLASYHRWVFENHKVECVEVLREWVIQEADFQCRALETVQGLTTQRSGRTETKFGNYKEPQRTFFGKSQFRSESTTGSQSQRTCRVCNKSHGVWACEEFKQMEVPERWENAKKLRICFRCLGEGHLGQYCTRTRTCGLNGCKELHHRLLHSDLPHGREKTTITNPCPSGKGEQPQLPPLKQKQGNEEVIERAGSSREGDQEIVKSKVTTAADATLMSGTRGNIVLRTIPVYLRNGGRRLMVNALLDDASTKTYLNTDVAAEMGLRGRLQRVNVSVLNGQLESFETAPVECIIESLDGNTSMKVTAFTTGKVTGNMKAMDWTTCVDRWPHLRGLKFHKLGPRPIVDMLIGLDCADLHFSLQDVRGELGQPIARLTPLGWTCVGLVEEQQDYSTNFARTYFSTEETDVSKINTVLQKFWEVDCSSTEGNLITGENKNILESTQSTIQFMDGRYRVSIPWKGDRIVLPDNYPNALRRLQNLERTLSKSPEVAKAYQDTICGYLKKGYIREIKETETSNPRWYLPHFAIIRPGRVTTKTRIVFDASARFDGISLNDVIHQGPKLQQDLFDVLLRFRKLPVALICDIAEMYLQIRLYPSDRSCHRILWRNLDSTQKPTEYEFDRLVFGLNCSPFLAQLVARHHAIVHQQRYPMASETILKSTYMDDSMDSVEDDNQGIQLYQQLSKLWEEAGMRTHKWLSNSEVVLSHIPLSDRVYEVDLDSDPLPSVKTLGIMWRALEDVFTFVSNFADQECEWTKRIFLSKIATLFDPLGLMAPFLIRAKMLMQEVWVHGLEWDEKFPQELSAKVTKWFTELSMLSDIRVPRCLQVKRETKSVKLHTFVDASQEAYGAAVYIRVENCDGSPSLHLVASKTKVAPLQSISIPRLELMSAVLGIRLAKSVVNALSLEARHITYWTDSTNVLWWIRGYSRTFKPFIANRVGEIQMSSSPEQWRHVPTEFNPADYLTRGVKLEELIDLKTWWEGPEYLKKVESLWPKNIVENDPSEALNEVKTKYMTRLDSDNISTMLAKCEDKLVDPEVNEDASVWRLQPERFSSWTKLIRIQAWVMRFINNCHVSESKRLLDRELQLEEINDVETQIIREIQKELFHEEYIALVKKNRLPKHSKLLNLSPRLDDDGVIRSDGRLKYAEFLPFDTRYPIILPRRSWVTKLIVKNYHELGNHSTGTNQTLSSLSSKYWILAAREAIIEWERECGICRRRKAKNATQIMAPLPLSRLKTSLRAFTRCAVDFAGPFVTVQGRGKRRQKRYLCLFTCLASRAVHLEMAYGLDVDSFLSAFNRMINRRGLPEEIISDNGTNFVAAEKELGNLTKDIVKDPKFVSTMTTKKIKWTFNPPYAPHFGGVFETMIKAAKKAIVAIMGNSDVTDEELTTAFTSAEALVNSRPLTYQSASPQDDIPLTPNHLMHGQLGGMFAPETNSGEAYYPLKRWRRVQELTRHFWKRWLQEWLPSLSPRQKWQELRNNLKVGDVVLMMMSDSPRAHWPLARIVEVYKGVDGNVRSAKIQVSDRNYIRPIVKLCPLELD